MIKTLVKWALWAFVGVMAFVAWESLPESIRPLAALTIGIAVMVYLSNEEAKKRHEALKQQLESLRHEIRDALDR